MIAMAMACSPDLLIFDEPTTALDVTTQIEVLASVREAIEAYDNTAIYITHDLAVVAQVADRITVLRYGEIVETGATRQIIEDPKQDYTRALLSVRTARGDVAVQGDAETILEIDGVTAAYGTFIALREISISIRRGKTVSVVGESGSGKSTLARVVAGLLPPSRGEVRFAGQTIPTRIRDRDIDTLLRLQMIYQSADTALNPKHRVRKIIGRPLSFCFGMRGRARDERTAELLDKIELGEGYMDRLPAELSGGEKQRICIARALAAEPDLIICDEITSSLDQLVAEGILKLLQNLQNDLSVYYMFITHDLDTVRAISDQIVVMYQGSVV